MAGRKISDLMDIWAAFQQVSEPDSETCPPFANAQDMYDKIDSTEVGGVSWQVSVSSLRQD